MAEDVEVAVNELSPRSTQSIERATMSPTINALTNDTASYAVHEKHCKNMHANISEVLF